MWLEKWVINPIFQFAKEGVAIRNTLTVSIIVRKKHEKYSKHHFNINHILS